MKIEDACEDKGALPELTNMYCLIVRHTDKKIVPCWYDAKTDHFLRHVSGEEAIRTDWQPFPEVKDIKPKKGELWKFKSNAYPHYIIEEGGELHFAWIDGSSEMVERSDRPLIHNKNGWTRISPKPEDDSVERIEVFVIGNGPIDTMLISAKGLESLLHGKDGKLFLELS